jgi:hypothetical protein
MSFLVALRKLLYPVTRLVFVRVALVEGVLRKSGIGFRTLVVGEGWAVEGLVRASYDAPPRALFRRRVLILHAFYLMVSRRTEYDAAVAALPSLYDRLGRRLCDFQGLCSLHWKIDTRGGWPSILSNMNQSMRHVMKVLESDPELHCRRSTSAADFEVYYHHMYLPLVHERHGENSLLSSYEMQRDIFRNGMLFLLERSGVAIAGVLANIEDGVLVYQTFGILDGDPQVRQSGALVALYYVGLKFASEQKLSAVDTKYTLPLLNDGVAMHKAALGARVSHQTWLGHMFYTLGEDRAKARRLFIDHPVAIDRDGHLNALTAVGDPKSFARCAKRWKSWGFEDVEIIPGDEGLSCPQQVNSGAISRTG